MVCLLVVEDERKLLRSLQRGLEAEGYEVVTAVTGTDAQARLSAGSFDALILDWMLPGKDGIQILNDLRTGGQRLPVLLLTARDAVADRVLGLDAGADDYLVKPFAFAELLARVRALLRRGKSDRETILHAGDLEVDLLERRVTREDEEIELRGREYEVLVYLLRHQGAVVTRDMLGRDVWKEPQHSLTNVIDVTITLLRKKLERPGLPPLIHTVRGIGYCLRT
ncbi:MAG: response regulator transcription factor [Gemmataceae bacterium]|nr:response regulator transcription factor [Gemmataceae bacterium]